MLVDKMSTPGGNSIINGGAVAAAGTDMQEKEGIKDSADLLFADIMKAASAIPPSPAASPMNPSPTSSGCATTSASSSRP